MSCNDAHDSESKHCPPIIVPEDNVDEWGNPGMNLHCPACMEHFVPVVDEDLVTKRTWKVICTNVDCPVEDIRIKVRK